MPLHSLYLLHSTSHSAAVTVAHGTAGSRNRCVSLLSTDAKRVLIVPGLFRLPPVCVASYANHGPFAGSGHLLHVPGQSALTFSPK